MTIHINIGDASDAEDADVTVSGPLTSASAGTAADAGSGPAGSASAEAVTDAGGPPASLLEEIRRAEAAVGGS
ncbi:hypothetical protein ACFFOP_35765 [Sinosporangium siamense]|uniref:hypothetical protein n=1 Tax=Sinosporangium siamense TaxID=1367973 RepID=UPI0035EE0A6B